MKNVSRDPSMRDVSKVCIADRGLALPLQTHSSKQLRSEQLVPFKLTPGRRLLHVLQTAYELIGAVPKDDVFGI